ncbi:HEPN domain-containing protein [Nitrososphaera viennensis]|uniref:HEPN domain-containing protein n=2 Tax=Nitrososphaera viennensis TaxID=1034015 RepID=A0A060HUT4_9ARCH|nr:HEPN domain-containing protein [Nitrososphaera viennensis]AIC17186.1 hypothetical protein NVIE_029100 [Nitrososphaera viennensis EN76]UVS69075.1 HEPN domain-containing protein [Nitrososphaera viennensis]
MLWYEFLIQAKKDMQRARSLHREEDYGFAAYSCQQGLEKYLKAFLLKNSAIDRPADISHADMIKLFNIINKKTKAFVDSHGSAQIVPDADLQDAKKNLNDLLETVQPNPRISETDRLMTKTQLWKFSLQLPVDKAYESRFELRKELLRESLKPVGEGFRKYYEKEIVPMLAKIPIDQKRLAAQKYASEGGHFSDFMAQVTEGDIPTLNVGDFNLCMIALLTYMGEALRRNNYHRSADLWLERKKIFLLVYPYNFYTSIMKTYPHEDFGRYPTMIDGRSSLDLYPLYAENLSKLISEVENDCAKVENAIYGKWDKA